MNILNVTITAEKTVGSEHFTIMRDGKHTAFVSIRFSNNPRLKGMFFASGWNNKVSGIIEHDYHSRETLDDFVKAVFRA